MVPTGGGVGSATAQPFTYGGADCVRASGQALGLGPCHQRFDGGSVEPDRHNHTGSFSHRWATTPRARRLRHVISDFGLVRPGLDLFIAHGVTVDRMLPGHDQMFFAGWPAA